MKIVMKIKERVVLRNILPAKWSYTDMALIEDINKKVTLSSDEIKEYEVKELPGGNLGWNPEKDTWVDIEFSKWESNIVKRTLSDLNEKQEITSDTMGLYDTFV